MWLEDVIMNPKHRTLKHNLAKLVRKKPFTFQHSEWHVCQTSSGASQSEGAQSSHIFSAPPQLLRNVIFLLERSQNPNPT